MERAGKRETGDTLRPMEQGIGENEENKTYSIALRLRRVVYEDAYISVPVTDAVIRVKDDGSGTVDFKALVAQGIRIGESEGVQWKVEESQIEIHPVQGPLPKGRQNFSP
ncbi:MAG: hypothetical protein EOP09_20275 [Proteobacteria bacterium]|nr:MAG: hypothetical protein EOP09_20275 [Pseudomonadota bacterium]